jgi:hypothetical protein
VYLTGRNIGDEYRYIIDRNTPANIGMLERPSFFSIRGRSASPNR